MIRLGVSKYTSYHRPHFEEISIAIKLHAIASVIAGSASTMRKPEIDYSFNVQLPFTMATLQ